MNPSKINLLSNSLNVLPEIIAGALAVARTEIPDLPVNPPEYHDTWTPRKIREWKKKNQEEADDEIQR